jgi:hypothetical protein
MGMLGHEIFAAGPHPSLTVILRGLLASFNIRTSKLIYNELLPVPDGIEFWEFNRIWVGARWAVV